MTLRNWNRSPWDGEYNPVTITDEPYTVGYDTDLAQYGIRLSSAPLRTESSGNVTIKRVSDSSELTEVARTIAPSAGEYRVDYEADTYLGTGWVQMNASDNGLQVLASYQASGDVIKGGAIPELSTDNTFTGANAFTGKTLFGNQNIYLVKYNLSHPNTAAALTTATWVTRVWNTESLSNITGASLSSNQITLPTGTYRVDAVCPAYNVQEHQARLYSITGATTLIWGSMGDTPSGNATTTPSFLRGYITLASSTVLEVQHICTTGSGGGQGGSTINGSIEGNFGYIEFQKVA